MKFAIIIGFQWILLQIAAGAVTLSPMNPEVLEHDPLTLICVTNKSTVIGFGWGNVVESGIRKAICTLYNNNTSSGCFAPVPGLEPNPAAYSYACPSLTRHELTIRNVTSDLMGSQWNCKSFTPTEDSNNVNISVKVPVRSVVLMSPVTSSVTEVENIPIDFRCEVPRSLPSATIQWYHDNKTPDDRDDDVPLSQLQESTSNNADLTLNTTSIMKFVPTRSHNGVRVYCTANNGYGNTHTSDRRTLINVKYSPDGPPVIQGFTTNSNYLAIRSTSQQLTCSVNGGYPLANITWNCYGGTVDNQLISGQNVSRTVTWTVGSNEQQCTCISNQEVAGQESSSINVKVLYPPDAPHYKVGSATMTAISEIRIVKNRAVEITCNSDSNPAPSAWRWSNPYGAVIQTQGKVLSIQNPQLTDAGLHTCEAENEMIPSQGSSVKGKNSSSVNIELLYPPSSPVFHWQNETGAVLPDNTIVAVKGDFLTIICDSDSKPGPSAYSWTNKRWTITADTDVQKTCTASNTMNPSGYPDIPGSNQATAKVKVLVPPRVPTFSFIDCQNTQATLMGDLKVKVGTNVSVTCSSTGNPQPSFQWSSHQSSSPETLFIQGVSRQDNISYTCSARNTMNTTFTGLRIGSKAAAVNLNVLYPPSVDSIKTKILLEGGNLTVDCPVQPGYPTTTTIKWTRREGIIQSSTTDQILKLVNVPRHQSDYYTCTATNRMEPSGCPPEDGSDASEFYIDVQYEASIHSFRESSLSADAVTLNQGDPLNIICTVDSNPGSNMSIRNDNHVLNTTQAGRKLTYRVEKSSCETNMGVYRCLGRNIHNSGYVNKTLAIFIKCGPRVPRTVTLIKNVTSDINVSATMSFTVVAYPANVQYVWEKLESEASSRTLGNTSKVTFVISENGLQSNITIGNMQESDFGEYRVTATNTIGSTYQNFYLIPQAKPETPKSLTFRETTVSSVILSWIPGFNGGIPQKFVIQYKRKTDTGYGHPNEIEDKGVYNVTIADLRAGTEYEANIHAVNSIGASGSISIFFTTLLPQDPPKPPLGLIGGAVGGTLFLVLVAVVIVVIWRIRISKNTSNDRDSLTHGQKLRSISKSNKSENDDDLPDEVENPMYIRSDDVEGPRDVADVVYSQPHNINAKTKVTNDVYAVVNKKSHLTDTDLYENADDMKGSIKKKKTRPSKTKEKTTNQEGLVYADLVFSNPPKGQKRLVIHGLDDMTEYAEVDLTRKADPLPDSDDEDKNKQQK